MVTNQKDKEDEFEDDIEPKPSDSQNNIKDEQQSSNNTDKIDKNNKQENNKDKKEDDVNKSNSVKDTMTVLPRTGNDFLGIKLIVIDFCIFIVFMIFILSFNYFQKKREDKKQTVDKQSASSNII